MTDKLLVALTRRLPATCEARLQARYAVRLGDDQESYDAPSLVQHAVGASALIVTPAERFDVEVIANLPTSVKVVSTSSVGFEHIDLDAARARDIRVTHTPGVLTDATADVAMLLILAATRRTTAAQRVLQTGRWQGLRPTQFLGTQITGKRLGIVGMGAIGAATALRAHAFGMQVFYHNRRPSPQAANATFVPSLDQLLAQSDVLSLHCPLTPQTKNLLDSARLSLLPMSAVVINTARGGLIDDDALIAALKSGRVSAAGLDVYANEPNIDRRYLELENVIVLPHIGSATVETRTAMAMLAIDNVDAVLEGREPPHPVL